MNKKYILTEETKEVHGHILHRIQALRDFRDVKAGDLGGWIESELNLFHDGNCWVYAEAKVYDTAIVYGSGVVRGEAEVFENARVYGRAWVYENAQVYGNAKVYEVAQIRDNAQVFEDARVYGKAEIRANAWIFGEAEIYGDVQISKNADIRTSRDYICLGPIGSRDAYTTFYCTKDNDILVCCGCFNGSIEEFKAAVIKKHERTAFCQEYLDAINYAKQRFHKKS